MSKLSSRRPSPAMIVAIVALFAALGGSAYAAKKIGTKEIKANAITAAKIKKNAVTAPKIKAGAVTGAKINEATLGPVPSATHANTATTATNAANATNAENAKNFSRFFASGLKKASVGETITLLTIGPFSIIGKCQDSGGDPEATTHLTTSQGGSSMYSYEDQYDETNFNPGTEVELGYYANAPGPYIRWYEQYPYYTGWWAASGDGAYLLHGDAVNAVNVYGSQCAFWVEATNAA